MTERTLKFAAKVNFFRVGVSHDEIVLHESYLEKLKTLRDEAVAEGRYSAAIAPEIARGKAAGLYVEQSHIDGDMYKKSVFLYMLRIIYI